jgi:hypothetical protein
MLSSLGPPSLSRFVLVPAVPSLTSVHPVGDPAFVEKTWQDTAARELGVALFGVDIKSTLS